MQKTIELPLPPGKRFLKRLTCLWPEARLTLWHSIIPFGLGMIANVLLSTMVFWVLWLWGYKHQTTAFVLCYFTRILFFAIMLTAFVYLCFFAIAGRKLKKSGNQVTKAALIALYIALPLYLFCTIWLLTMHAPRTDQYEMGLYLNIRNRLDLEAIEQSVLSSPEPLIQEITSNYEENEQRGITLDYVNFGIHSRFTERVPDVTLKIWYSNSFDTEVHGVTIILNPEQYTLYKSNFWGNASLPLSKHVEYFASFNGYNQEDAERMHKRLVATHEGGLPAALKILFGFRP